MKSKLVQTRLHDLPNIIQFKISIIEVIMKIKVAHISSGHRVYYTIGLSRPTV